MVRAHSLFSIVVCLVFFASPLIDAQDAAAQPSQASEVFGAWSVTTMRNKAEDGTVTVKSQLLQETKRQEDGRRICSIYLAKSPNADAVEVVIIGPFGVDIASGAQLMADDKRIIKALYKTSLPGGIVSEFQLSFDLFADLLKAEKAAIQFVTSDNQTPFQTPIVLEGLEEAWARHLAIQR